MTQARKTALVTGGSRGIGRVTAMRLVAAGYRVAFTYRSSAAAARAFESEVGGTEGLVIGFEADAKDGARTESVINEIVERFGSLDALVNNAGIREDALAYNMTDEQWENVLSTNLDGAFRAIRACLPAMMRQRSGAIVNVASLSGLHGVIGQANYAAAKGGMIAMTRTIAREVARSGIRVNCVAPGLVETDMTEGLTPEVKREMLRDIPMRRTVKADEVASAIAFLLSDDASAITGQVLCVDGGVSA